MRNLRRREDSVNPFLEVRDGDCVLGKSTNRGGLGYSTDLVSSFESRDGFEPEQACYLWARVSKTEGNMKRVSVATNLGGEIG